MSGRQWGTCRLCDHGIEPVVDAATGYRNLHKVGVRHYVHAACGLRKWGAAFLDRLHDHEIGNLPALLLDRHGLTAAARARMARVGTKAER